MGDFFKGWRRKISLALLAVALLLTVPWMRSYVVFDELLVQPPVGIDDIGPRLKHIVRSEDGAISWDRTTNSSGQAIISDTYVTSWNCYHRPPPSMVGIPSSQTIAFHWRRQFAGFDFGAATQHSLWLRSYSEFWTIPYWSLVLPLTLFSAYLLLIKPRAAKPPISNQDAVRAGD